MLGRFFPAAAPLAHGAEVTCDDKGAPDCHFGSGACRVDTVVQVSQQSSFADLSYAFCRGFFLFFSELHLKRHNLRAMGMHIYPRLLHRRGVQTKAGKLWKSPPNAIRLNAHKRGRSCSA
jgi:hypothetical protein